MTPLARFVSIASALVVCTSVAVHTQSPRPAAGAEWPYYAADAAATHYSPLDQITRENVSPPEAGLGVEARRGCRSRSTARGPARSRTRR